MLVPVVAGLAWVEQTSCTIVRRRIDEFLSESRPLTRGSHKRNEERSKQPKIELSDLYGHSVLKLYNPKLLLRSYLHRASLRLLSFRQVESQNTIGIAGFSTLRIDRRGESKCLLEGTSLETIPVHSGINCSPNSLTNLDTAFSPP